ncbi:MAG: hypothetical protein ACQEVA_01415 [Myxococcota bacterium]
MRARSYILCAGLALLFFGVGCPEAGPIDQGQTGPSVKLVSVDFDQELILGTSVLAFRMQNTDRVAADRARVTFQGGVGAVGSLDQSFEGAVTRPGDVGDATVELDTAQTLWPALNGQSDTSFDGRITVELLIGEEVVARGRVESAQLILRRTVAPSVDAFSASDVYSNQRIRVTGSNVLRASEGNTVAVVEQGTVTPLGGESRSIDGEVIALDWVGSRDETAFPVDPAVFGVRPASFEATLRFENRFSDDEIVQGSSTVEISGQIKETFVARLSPEAGSRGQKITFIGRGFVPNNEAEGYGMFMRYEGVFDPSDEALPGQRFEGDDALIRTVDEIIDEERAIQSVWYEVTEGRQLTGLGAAPGTFEGSITPVLFDAYGERVGVAWEGTFRVLPTTQVVYLKYLPAFSRGLEKYGLRNVERSIRDRVLEVVQRDYEGVNVEFREDRPDDYVDFATIEIGGPDPSGSRAFGYDNSFNGVAKDTGNLFLADYLGGVNAQAAEEFNNPYGGIFIESFSFFSKELNPDNAFASSAFDRVFRPFMPALGGDPVRGTEWPDGERSDAIAEAIHVTGSVIGNTVTHELGHSLGLTYFEGDETEPGNRFHNEDVGKYIMDPGGERPFEERAEIGPVERARFNEKNQAYLQRHLPRP